MRIGKFSQIEDFGAVGAEDDDGLLDYFLSTPTVAQVESGRKMLILGRKGSGKTALVRYFGEATSSDALHIPLRLGEYPWGAHSRRKNTGASDVEVYASSWRYLIAIKTLSSIMSNYRKFFMSEDAAIAQEFLSRNFETSDVDLKNILVPSTITLTSATVSAGIPDTIGGQISWEKAASRPDIGILIDRVSDCLFLLCERLASEAKVASVFLHFDELDLGLQALTDERRSLLSGLAIASRSVRNIRNSKLKIYPTFELPPSEWSIDYDSLDQEGTTNACEEAQARGDYREAA